jgi:hypothetical protein
MMKKIANIIFLFVFLALIVVAYLYIFPAYMTSQVIGLWCLKVTEGQSPSETRFRWSLTATIPFTVDEHGDLEGTGKYTFTPGQQNSDFAYTKGTFKISGLYNPMKNRFEINFGSLPLIQDYTIASGDEQKKAMTASQLPIISSTWYWKAVDIQASDGAYLGQTPSSTVAQGWRMVLNQGSCK